MGSLLNGATGDSDNKKKSKSKKTDKKSSSDLDLSDNELVSEFEGGFSDAKKDIKKKIRTCNDDKLKEPTIMMVNFLIDLSKQKAELAEDMDGGKKKSVKKIEKIAREGGQCDTINSILLAMVNYFYGKG